ncbi:MAG TPA: hypothetical protein VG102_01550 [Candidatus Paceibacterota bacterium]|jgi:hypothetical protein|nr:hypothetical protein [Candidatus Paceibacterota bacterium]
MVSTSTLVVLKGLQGSPPVTLTPLQQLLAPLAPQLELLWWVLWSGVLLYLFIYYIVLPFIRKKR